MLYSCCVPAPFALSLLQSSAPVVQSVLLQVAVGSSFAIALLAVAALFRRPAVWGITTISSLWWLTYGVPFALRQFYPSFVLPAALLLGAVAGPIPLVRWSMDVFRTPQLAPPRVSRIFAMILAFTFVGWLLTRAPWEGRASFGIALDNAQRLARAGCLLLGAALS